MLELQTSRYSLSLSSFCFVWPEKVVKVVTRWLTEFNSELSLVTVEHSCLHLSQVMCHNLIVYFVIVESDCIFYSCLHLSQGACRFTWLTSSEYSGLAQTTRVPSLNSNRLWAQSFIDSTHQFCYLRRFLLLTVYAMSSTFTSKDVNHIQKFDGTDFQLWKF